MDEAHGRRAHSILREAAELTRAERDAFVERACAGDERLRSHVRRLVSALDRSTGFLDRPALASEPQEGHGTDAIGAYRIVGVVGSGGMATVYEAIQDRPQRRVALKVMNRGMLRTSAVQRFQFETEVLARLRHPAIAQILEAGTHDDGHGAAIPFFAMEYVEGARTITAYAAERRLAREDRLSMLAEVCDAVQHGHQNGVIHRDIKPGNVLVDSAGRPKVIDFGIARSTDPGQERITREVEAGRVIGTLNSMSPEQCAGGDIDARTDVYALGVLLYELLCDRPPHDLAGVGLPEALRIVQEEPPRRPASIDERLAGDLEAIVLQAMEKDPQRRYPSAAALATDIRHYLRSEPIEARPPTLFTQCRLFARRNRGLVASMAALGLMLVVATGVSGAFAYRASREAGLRAEAESTAIVQRDEARRQAYVANIAGAQAALLADEFEQARRRLAAAPEALRGWEWGFLSALATASERTIGGEAELDDMLDGLAIDESGELLFAGGRAGVVGIWRSTDGHPVAVVEGTRERAPLPFAPSPDGSRLALPVGDEESGRRLSGWLTIWDIGSGCEVARLGPFPERVTAVAWSPEAILACAGGVGHLWRDADGGERLTLADQPGGITGAAMSRDGALMATWGVGADGDQGPWTSVWLRRGDGQRLLAALLFPGSVRAGAFSRDGSLLAVGGSGGRTLVFGTSTGDVLRDLALAENASTVLALAFSPDGRHLACGHVNRRIQIWSLETGEVVEELRGHAEAVSGLAFSPDGRTLHSASWDRTLRTWTLAAAGDGAPRPAGLLGGGGGAVTRLGGHRDHVLCAGVSPDGSLIVTGSRDDVVRLWDADHASLLEEFDGAGGDIYATVFAPDGALLATGGDDQRVHLWSMPGASDAGVLEGHQGTIWSLAFQPSGERLASCGNDRTVRLWSMATRRVERVLKGHAGRVIDVAFSSDGSLLASASRDGTVRLWEMPGGRALHELEGHQLDVFAVVFSRDGRLLFSGCRDQTVRVWDATSGTCERVLDGHGQFVTSLALSPDGTRLAAGSWFGEIVLWDVAGGDPAAFEQVASFRGHEAPIRDVQFTPDGLTLLSASYDGTVNMYRASPPRRGEL